MPAPQAARRVRRAPRAAPRRCGGRAGRGRAGRRCGPRQRQSVGRHPPRFSCRRGPPARRCGAAEFGGAHAATPLVPGAEVCQQDGAPIRSITTHRRRARRRRRRGLLRLDTPSSLRPVPDRRRRNRHGGGDPGAPARGCRENSRRRRHAAAPGVLRAAADDFCACGGSHRIARSGVARDGDPPLQRRPKALGPPAPRRRALRRLLRGDSECGAGRPRLGGFEYFAG
mmetsp:Transcript_10252/g.36128  ORF Transcript_10252/g.36128 Transcript_10252/m.36128 type:complete len:227 (+) Transcript_10252:845-1525(+)